MNLGLTTTTNVPKLSRKKFIELLEKMLIAVREEENARDWFYNGTGPDYMPAVDKAAIATQAFLSYCEESLDDDGEY